jgi:O-antigen/teichoic acid export membrane protein
MLRNLAYACVSAASAGLLFVLLIIAGRTLGDVEFGKFSFALALGTIFETLMDFGFHQVIIRAIARDKSRARELLRHAMGLKAIWAAGALAALVATATFLRPERDVRAACYLLGGSLVLRSYMLTIRGALQGLERFAWDSVVVVGDRAILLIFGVVALASGAGLHGLAIAFVAARAAALGLSMWLTHAQFGGFGLRFDPAIWRELQATALPIGFFLVVINVYAYVDSVMLGIMRTDVETGLYTAAYRAYEGLSYPASAVAAVLTPRLSNLFRTDRRGHRRIAILGLAGAPVLAVVISAFAYLLATPLMVGIWGNDFAPAATPFRILSVGLCFVFAIWVLHALAISVDRERVLLKTAVVGLVANVALNLYVIPRMGASGAAVATVAGELVSMIALVVSLRSEL